MPICFPFLGCAAPGADSVLLQKPPMVHIDVPQLINAQIIDEFLLLCGFPGAASDTFIDDCGAQSNGLFLEKIVDEDLVHHCSGPFEIVLLNAPEQGLLLRVLLLPFPHD